MNMLAQLSPQQQQAMGWLAVLLGVVIVGGIGIMWLRRLLRDPKPTSLQDGGFSLSELRAMRDRGEITPEEYEATRQRVISKVKSSTHAPPRDPDENSNSSASP